MSAQSLHPPETIKARHPDPPLQRPRGRNGRLARQGLRVFRSRHEVREPLGEQRVTIPRCRSGLVPAG